MTELERYYQATLQCYPGAGMTQESFFIHKEQFEGGIFIPKGVSSQKMSGFKPNTALSFGILTCNILAFPKGTTIYKTGIHANDDGSEDVYQGQPICTETFSEIEQDIYLYTDQRGILDSVIYYHQRWDKADSVKGTQYYLLPGLERIETFFKVATASMVSDINQATPEGIAALKARAASAQETLDQLGIAQQMLGQNQA